MEQIDQAQQNQMNEIKNRLKNRPKPLILAPKSACYYCDEELVNPKLFCDADCRDDYELLRTAKERSGR